MWALAQPVCLHVGGRASASPLWQAGRQAGRLASVRTGSPSRCRMQQRCAPPQVSQPSPDQRLSSRKITCKAFPFVVEEQRVTSYFLLVKKKKKRSGCTFGDFVDLPPNFSPEPVAGRGDLGCVFWRLSAASCWSYLVKTVGWDYLRNGARLWNKKVNLLVVCFAGYECFQPLRFTVHSLWFLKEKKSIRFLFFLTFILF